MFVGILCPNYSGSTVVGGILHRFSDVQNVGEIWKLFSQDPSKMFCFECRPKECSYFTNDFIRELQYTSAQSRVDILKERFDAKYIVSGDKGPRYYNKFGVLPDKVLILIKNKYAAAFSYAKRNRDFETASQSKKIEMLIAGAKEYFDILLERIDWAEKNYSKSGRIFSSPDILAEAKDEDLILLSKLIFDEKLLINHDFFDEKLHYIGGNHKLSKGNDRSFFNGEFKADKRYEKVFTEEMYLAVDDYVRDNVSFSNIEDSNFRYLESWVTDSLTE